jgi:hypothetical protein
MLRNGYIELRFFPFRVKANFACPILQQLPVYDSSAARVMHCAVKSAERSMDQCADADS